MPIAIATAVSSIVFSRPRRIRLEKRNSRTISQWNRGFVPAESAIAATRKTTTAAEIHRPGCRTGTALISSA
jgi:hypothetical protein